MKLEILSVIILLICIFFFYIFSYYFNKKKKEWISGFFTSVATSLVAGLIFYFAVDSLYEAKVRDKNEEMRRYAHLNINQLLNNHIEFLRRLSNSNGSDITVSLDTAFNSNYFEKISRFNILSESNYYDEPRWEKNIFDQFVKFRKRLEGIESSYMPYLEEDVQLFEELIKSTKFFPPPGVYAYVRNEIPKKKTLQPFSQGIMDGYKDHINKTIEFIETHNKVVQPEKRIKVFQVGSVPREAYVE